MSTLRRIFSVAFLAGCSLLAAAAAQAVEPHQLLSNFTAPLSQNDAIRTSVDFDAPHAGLASARLDYRLHPTEHRATLNLPEQAYRFSGPGVLKLWVKGRDAGHQLQLVVRHGVIHTDPQGNRSVQNQQQIDLPPLKLEAGQWQQAVLPVPQIPPGNIAWWQELRISAPPPQPAANAPPDAKPQPTTGSVQLDELIFCPTGAAPTGTFGLALIGPSARPYGSELAWSADLRSFLDRSGKAQLRLTMTDRNDNVVVDRNFAFELKAGQAEERRLELAPENLQLFLPPFKVSGDLISTDWPELNAKVDQNVVMGNSLLLFDTMADVYGRWFTSGMEGFNNAQAAGAAQRSSPLVQTASRIERVQLAPPGKDQPAPPGRWAMKWDYQGPATVFTGSDRFLPGNAYRLGVWIKGDNSGAKLHALTLDYSDLGDFYEGGWKRIRDGERLVCTLDFDDWRYFEYDLPGLGVGGNDPNGSTDGLDFPLELTGLRIEPATGDKAPRSGTIQTGTVQIGPIFTRTQQAYADTLVAHLGYDDANHRYAPEHKAWCTVQNAWTTGTRKLKLRWTLLDRDDQPVASAPLEAELAGTAQQTLPIDLAPHAAAIATRPFPLRLQVEAVVADEGSTMAAREIVLSRPDSAAQFADFEAERGYLGLKAQGIANAPAPGELAAFTSADQAHGGKRSLAIAWEKAKQPQRFVSLDPALPGLATDVSMWVHGDGSGAIFYPILGDRRGVRHGLATSQFDLVLARVADGPLQNGVRLDWQGWREVKFQLPLVPPQWRKELPVLGYLPSYPLGLHLAVDARGATTDAGQVYVDDIRVSTHLPADARQTVSLVRADQTNVVAPGGALAVDVANCDLAQPAKLKLVSVLSDWSGRQVAGGEQPLELTAGEQRRVTVADKLPPGAYALHVTLIAGERSIATLDDDLLVADLAGKLGDKWRESLSDEWQLRSAIGDKFTLLDEDWDWVENFPGNAQVTSLRMRTADVTKHGADPFVLLGYSAYWAAEDGYRQLTTDSFVRPGRDIGHAVGIFMSPARVDDWDNYMLEVMRGAGRDARGWVLWDNPAGNGPLHVEPEKFAALAASADKWRRVYSPDAQLIIGGMNRQNAIPYLTQLAEHKALDNITGVNVRLDVGRMSPEDARIASYLRELRATLQSGTTPSAEGAQPAAEKTILLTDLDWAVEKGDAGLTAFDQAAYLIRADLLMHQLGLQPALSVRNEDAERLGVGLSYRRELVIPPLKEKLLTWQLKPAWWGIAKTREWLAQLTATGEVDVQDIVPGRTRCLAYRRTSDQRPVAIVWRNDQPGFVSLAGTGLQIESAADLLGATVPAVDGAVAVGKLPVVLVLAAANDLWQQSLARLRVRDQESATWPQQPLAAFSPLKGEAFKYQATGSEPATLAGSTISGDKASWQGLRFAAAGSEQFTVDVPEGASLVLKKRFLLAAPGEQAEVFVGGQSAGKWDLRPSDQHLAGGLREATLLIDRKLLAGKPQASIEVRYVGPATSAGWTVLECRDEAFPLTALAPLHADQNVGHLRMGRSVIGESIKVGTTSYDNGLGVMAKSLIEYPLAGQFRRLTAEVGVDAATEGRGSVVFEVYADGKKLWSSGLLSGLDQAKKLDVDVSGAQRLRLVVTDGGDGNKFDAADWCDPTLHR